jgi:hypothetical protein
MTNIIPITKPHKTTHTKTDTVLVTTEIFDSWKAPPFQRGLRENQKVRDIVDPIKSDGVIPGIITLGILEKITFLLDGQHRMHAFRLSGLSEAYADVRVFHAQDMAEMAEEYVRLNGKLVTFRPDDILKGLEAYHEPLQLIRKKCPWVGYDFVRRNDKNAPLVSMSAIVRCWAGSSSDTPKSSTNSAASLAKELGMHEAASLAEFLLLCFDAWGKDSEYHRLWGNLNLTICMWLYHHTVLSGYSHAAVRLTKDQFKHCLMALSADPTYVDWLLGRQLGERDRNPCYNRIKTIFATRLEKLLGKKVRLPSPSWYTVTGGKR